MKSTLIIELWEDGEKVAEFPLHDLDHLTQRQEDSFWELQDRLNRKAMLRYEAEPCGQ